MYLSKLENVGETLVYLRPGRFGKIVLALRIAEKYCKLVNSHLTRMLVRCDNLRFRQGPDKIERGAFYMEKHDEEKNNSRKVMSLLVLCVSIIAITVSLSYAYYTTQLGTNEEQEVSITAGTMALTFRDNSAELNPKLNGTWNLGDSVEKILEIENTGTLPVYAKISWDNLVNTYMAESLSYKLEEKSDEEGATYKDVPTTNENVPRSTTASTQELANGLLIPAGHTYTYRLTIKFEDLKDVDQTDDLEARFVTKFTLDEGSAPVQSTSGVDVLLAKANDVSITSYADGIGTEMFAFEHEATDQIPIAQTDYRYIGANPNNYIDFNDETWRIIGVFPVINTATGEYENRIKIMRSESIVDLSYSRGQQNIYVGGNIQVALNGDYYNRAEWFDLTGLTETARSQITSATWYLGASIEFDSGPDYYTAERSNTLVDGGNQDLNTEQQVGLIYPSDYAYSYTGATQTTGWMYCDIIRNTARPWTITPVVNSSNVISISGPDGNFDISPGSNHIYDVLPTVYLRPDITLKGTGSSEDHYTIE